MRDVTPVSRILNYGGEERTKKMTCPEMCPRHISRGHVSRVAELSRGPWVNNFLLPCAMSCGGFARARPFMTRCGDISPCLVGVDTNGRPVKFPTKIDNVGSRETGEPRR